MKIIYRSFQVVRSLNPVERESVRLYQSGNNLAQPLLAKIRESRHWLECDCQSPAPIIHVALRDNGRFVLKNNRDGAEHLSSCPFARDISSNGYQRSLPRSKNDRISCDGHITLHSEIQRTRSGITQQISRSDAIKQPRKNSLLALLLTFVDAAGLNIFDPSRELSVSDQFESLRRAASRFVISPGIPLDHLLDTRISKQRLYAMSKRLRETDQFGAARRYGLLLDVVKQCGPRHLTLDDDSALSFFGSAEVFHSKSTPMLTLCTVTTQASRMNFYELGRTAFMPVFSRGCFFPVINDEDRSVIREIFGLLNWLKDKKDVRVSARRSLFEGDFDHQISLKSGPRIVTVDLEPSVLGGSMPSPAHLSLAHAGSIESLKKQIASTFLKSAKND